MYVVGLKIKKHRLGFLSFRRAWVQYYLLGPGVFGVAVVVFLDMVGILEGFAMPRRELPCPPATLLSEVSEHADCVSSRSKSEASLPRRLLARLPARLPARLVGRLAVFLGSARGAQSPVSTGTRNGSTAAATLVSPHIAPPRGVHHTARLLRHPPGTHQCPPLAAGSASSPGSWYLLSQNKQPRRNSCGESFQPLHPAYLPGWLWHPWRLARSCCWCPPPTRSGWSGRWGASACCPRPGSPAEEAHGEHHWDGTVATCRNRPRSPHRAVKGLGHLRNTHLNGHGELKLAFQQRLEKGKQKAAGSREQGRQRQFVRCRLKKSKAAVQPEDNRVTWDQELPKERGTSCPICGQLCAHSMLRWLPGDGHSWTARHQRQTDTRKAVDQLRS